MAPKSLDFSRLQSIGRGGLSLVAALLTGCGPTQLGATDADLARARDQASQGAIFFGNECARCHGQHGEGLAGAPPIMGSGVLPEYPRDNALAGNPAFIDAQQVQIQQQTRPAGAPTRDPFRTAEDLYGYISVHLPKARASNAKPDDYWAVVTYMLAVQGATIPQGGINAGNAASVPIPRR